MTTKTKKLHWLSSPESRFVIILFSIYAIWKILLHFLLHGIWKAEWKHITDAIGTAYAAASNQILHIMGENTTYYGNLVVFLDSTKTMGVEEHCDGIPAMLLFAGSILLFSGSWKNKLWFVPMGLAVIITINLIRIVFTCYAWEHFSKFYFELNHSFIYVVITYGAILWMINIWMNKYSET